MHWCIACRYGAPYDRLARVFEAQIINDALNLTVTPEEVVGVTAEEATGISAAMCGSQLSYRLLRFAVAHGRRSRLLIIYICIYIHTNIKITTFIYIFIKYIMIISCISILLEARAMQVRLQQVRGQCRNPVHHHQVNPRHQR